MSEFLEEVKEDLRHEQLLKLWNRFRGWIIGSTIGFFVCTAGVIYYQNATAERDARQALALSHAVNLGQQGRVDDAIAALEALSQEPGSTYPMIARFRLASTRVARYVAQPTKYPDDLNKACAVLRDLEQSNADSTYLAIATIARLYLEMSSGAPETLGASLKPLQTSKNNWHELARELIILTKLTSSDTSSAHLLATELSEDPKASMALRQRAEALAETTRDRTTPPPSQASH